MDLTLTNRNAKTRGFTLPELMVSLVIGTVVILGAASFYAFGMTSFASMANYTDLNQSNRRAADLLSRDIRSANAVSVASSNQLVLNISQNGTNADATYTYDSAARTLTRSRLGTIETLLRGINSISWSLYARPGNSNYNTFPSAPSPAAAKLVSVQWNCSRSLGTGRIDSQSMQTALIELRNQ
jgi:prepilin-type N-terminal cleavage/methylation domain-containing protein